MSHEERARRLDLVRAERLARQGRPVLDEALVARDVAASEALVGQWLG